jgi:hypothetical protein
VEYARWMLERMELPHAFTPAAAGLSAIRSSRMKVPIEPPLVLVDGRPHGGFRNSFALVHDVLNARAPRPQAKPDPALAEDLFGSLFTQAVRSFYRPMLQHPQVLKPMSTRGVPAWNRWVVHGAYPLWRWVLEKGLKLGTSDQAVDDRSMQAVFARIADRLGGDPFLDGVAPGTNDILFAVIASPILLPPGHPVVMPVLAALPPTFRATVEHFRGLPAGKLALRIYAHRSARNQ